MTTPKSSFSQGRLWSCYQDALIRHKNAGIFYGVLSFIFLPLQFILTVLQHEPQFVERALFGYAKCYNGVSAFFFTALTLCAALIIPTNIFSFMHSRRAVDVYHALPYRRSELLLGNSAAGLTLLFVPIITNFLVIMAFGFKVPFFSYGDVLLEMTSWLVIVGVTFMLTVFASVQVGSVFDTAAFSLVLNGSVAALYLLVVALSESFLYGYSSDSQLLKTAYKLSPVSTIIGRIAISPRTGAERIAENNIAIAVWFVVAIVATLLALYFYDRRKSEQAEVLGTMGLLSAYARAVGTLLAGCAIGAAFCAVFDINNKIAVLGYIFVGAVIAYMIGDVILSRSVKNLRKSAPWALCMSIGTAAFVALFLYGGLGYETKIPVPTQIESVELRNYRGRYQNNDGYRNTTLLKSEQSIQTVTDMHAAHLRYFAENRTNHAVINRQALPDRIGHDYWITITYHLKNGRTMQRSYSLGLQDVGRYLMELETNPEFITENNAFFTTDAKNVKHVELFNTIGDKTTEVPLSQPQIEELLTAIREDMLAQTPDMLNASKSVGRIGVEVIRPKEVVEYEREFGSTYPEEAAAQSERTYTEYFSLNLLPSFERTLLLLEQYGLSEVLTNSPDAVTAAYIGLAGNYRNSSIIQEFDVNVLADITYSLGEDEYHKFGTFTKLPIEDFIRLYPKLVNLHNSSEPMAVVTIESKLNPGKITGYYYIPLSALEPALAEQLKVLAYQNSGEWMLWENGISVSEEWRIANRAPEF